MHLSSTSFHLAKPAGVKCEKYDYEIIGLEVHVGETNTKILRLP